MEEIKKRIIRHRAAVCIQKWMLYSLHMSKEDSTSPRWLKFSRWLVSTSVAACVGAVALAGSFGVLATIHPDTYRILTRWVNQPPVPVTKSCVFIELEEVNRMQSKALSFLKWYDVKFHLDSSIGSQSLAVAFSDDFRLAVYNFGHRKKPKESDPAHLFIGKTDFKSGEFWLTAVHDSSEGELGKMEFSFEECPIRLEFFGGSR